MATPAVTSLKNALFSVNVMEQLKNALGKRAEAFATSFLEIVTSNTDLQQCTPNALVMEALKAATLNLPLNKQLGYAYIVPFKNKRANTTDPQLIVGYKGLVQLAYRTNEYININNGVVYEGEYINGDKIKGTFSLAGQRVSDKVVGYFAYFQMRNGMEKMLYMSVEEMAAYAIRYSKGLVKFENGRAAKYTIEEMVEKANTPAPDFNAVGWANNFESMALKTVIRRLLSKWGFLSTEKEVSEILNSDTDFETESIANGAEWQDIDTEEVVDTPAAIEATAQRVADVMNAQAQAQPTEQGNQPQEAPFL